MKSGRISCVQDMADAEKRHTELSVIDEFEVSVILVVKNNFLLQLA